EGERAARNPTRARGDRLDSPASRQRPRLVLESGEIGESNLRAGLGNGERTRMNVESRVDGKVIPAVFVGGASEVSPGNGIDRDPGAFVTDGGVAFGVEGNRRRTCGMYAGVQGLDNPEPAELERVLEGAVRAVVIADFGKVIDRVESQ